MQSLPTLASATVITAEGLPIDSALPETRNRGRVATLGSALRGVPQRADAGLGTNPVSHMFVEGLAGQVILMIGDSGAHLVAVASRDSSSLEILSELQVCRGRVEAALREDREALRRWGQQGERHAGRRARLTTKQRRRLNDLEREIKELSSAGEILQAASARVTSAREEAL